MDRFAELEEQLRFLQIEIELERKARARERAEHEVQMADFEGRGTTGRVASSRSPSNGRGEPIGSSSSSTQKGIHRTTQGASSSPHSNSSNATRDIRLSVPLCRTSDVLYVTPPSSKSILSPPRPVEAAGSSGGVSRRQTTPTARRATSASGRNSATPVTKTAKESPAATSLTRHRADGSSEQIQTTEKAAKKEEPPARRASPAARTATTPNRLSSGSPTVRRAVTGTPRAQVMRSAASPRSSRPASSPAVAAPMSVAHAWYKFVNLVAGALSEDELALISAETLNSLLDSFHVTDSEERAQIEAHWSLLQRVVAEDASSLPSVVEVLHGGKSFNLRPDPLKPKLSKRVALDPQRFAGPRTSNIHDAVVPQNSRKEGRTVTPLRSIVPVASNPNEVETAEMYRKPCVHKVAVSETPATPRGEGIVTFAPRYSEDQVQRGLRAWGGTSEVTFDHPRKKECLRTDLEAPRSSLLGAMETHREALPKRGVRTYPTSHSNGDEHVESSLARRGHHAAGNRRDSLTTGFVVALPSRSPQPSTPLSPRQARTPFAVDA